MEQLAGLHHLAVVLCFMSYLLMVFLISCCQVGMPSPVLEVRSAKQHHESSWLEDSSFQQAALHIHTLRDPVSNRVMLVSAAHLL